MGGTAAITATAVHLQSDSSQTTTFKALFSTGGGAERHQTMKKLCMSLLLGRHRWRKKKIKINTNGEQPCRIVSHYLTKDGENKTN